MVATERQDDLIFDVGMHRGEDSEFYLRKGFRVVGIDADPELCRKTGARLAQFVADGRLTILNVAIAPKRGPVRFFRNPSMSVWGTLSPEWAARNATFGAASEEIEVAGVTFGDILAAHGTPHYLKIDIEGADTECLRSLEAWPARPKHVSLESELLSWPRLREEFRLLSRLGYRKFQAVQQTKVPAQVCPRPASEGVYVDHKFPDGATGLFGAELPGRWLTEREALHRYRAIFLRYRLFGQTGWLRGLNRGRARLPKVLRWEDPGWYDTHASI